MKSKEFFAGWENVDITPQQPVCLCGQFSARVSEGIKDPITSTICFFESVAQDGATSHAVIVSCDLVAIPGQFRKAIVEKTKIMMPDVRDEEIIISATHTHTAPEVGGDILRGTEGLDIKDIYGVELVVMEIPDYIEFASAKIAHGIKNAREKKHRCGIGFGLGFAVVGFNRRVTYYDGSSKMYGNTNESLFSHIEGYEDHSINIMGTWDQSKNLTGLIVNIACPSQVEEQLFVISADYWNEVRMELKRRFGEKIYVLPQCDTAGDQSPHVVLCKQAYQRMWNLSGRTQRQDIAIRVVDGIQRVLPDIEKDIDYQPEFKMAHKTLRLTGYGIYEKDLKEFEKEAEKHKKEYDRLKVEIEKNPEKKNKPRWYLDITYNFRRYRWYNSYKERCQHLKKNPKVPVDIYALRIGDMVFSTNPFELYLDYGLRIKARSPATQTFVVQLAGGGTYLPTERAVKGKSYGAIGPSCVVGPEGGKELVEQSLEVINSLWEKKL
ncbi:MAG: hypothetical protein NC831_01265 [Candidatus Omnitrophica bacterium]|nr:hypothetical protein [Candidatus Omnitrophota bacterium]MCM8828114.1 hypothetical protein [Candidatus Omnitrophota bacterium]